MERIAIFGGSGLYQLEGVRKKKELSMNTPFGKPSDKIMLAELDGREFIFLPRHDRQHSVNPSEINYRANVYAMKKLQVGRIVSVTACGSLKKGLKPLDFVIPLQFVDRTNQGRKQTFFEEGCVAHVGFAHPICEDLATQARQAAERVGVITHYGGTYLNMEGPQFSTLAESNLYRSWGMDIIGMTNMTEARLAREAEICYTTVAAITDYDCWHETEETVTVDVILNNLRKNIDNAKKIIKELIIHAPQERHCSCRDALKYAMVTDRNVLTPKTKKKLGVIIKKYI